MNRDQAKALLERLRMRTEARGATPAEAAQAAELAERIIRRYGLDRDAAATTEEQHELLERRWPPWATVLGMAIERRFALRGAMIRQRGERCRIAFTGPEHSCRVAVWLFRALEKDIRQSAERSAREAGRSGGDLVRWRNEFATAAAWSLFDRLNPIDAKRIKSRPCVVEESPPPRRKQRGRKVRRLTTEQMSAMLAGSLAGRGMAIDTNVIGDRRAEPVGLLTG